jgi:hypothetical protein
MTTEISYFGRARSISRIVAAAIPAVEFIRLTPGSIGYVKERIAVKTKTGVIGLDPGAGVRLVSEDGNAVSVSDGTTTFDVPKDKLTADVTEANLAAQNFYVTQQAGVEAFNAEVVRQQEERKRARDEQAAAEQREKEMKKEQIAAQHQQQLLQAQQSLAEWQAAWQWQAAQSSPYDLAAPAPNLSAHHGCSSCSQVLAHYEP